MSGYTNQKPLILIGVPTFPSPKKILPYLRTKLAELGVSEDEYEIKYAPLFSQKFVEGSNGEHAEELIKSEVFRDERGELVRPVEEDWKRASYLLGMSFPEALTSVKQTPNLKVLQLGSAGWGHLVNFPYYQSLTSKDPLIIATAAGVHAVPIPEHVISTTMMLFHGFPHYIEAQKQKPPVWKRMVQKGNGGFVVKELRGRTMGILAYGHIARETARMAKALGMNVIVATRTGEKTKIGGYIIEGTGDVEGEIPSKWYSTTDAESMKAFYSSSDVVVNTLPSNDATKGFVSATALRQMKNDAVFVNIGRGDTVDQEALITALRAGVPSYTVFSDNHGKEGDLRIGAASLDVTDPEPLPVDNELWGLDNVIITPHMSGGTEYYWYRVADIVALNFKRVVVDGKGAINAVRGKGEDE